MSKRMGSGIARCRLTRHKKNSVASDFALPAVDRRDCLLKDFADAKALVVIFIATANDKGFRCPETERL
jgi:hypothetical protein